MSHIGIVEFAQEITVTLTKVLASLVQILLALVGQMSPSIWVEGLVDVRISRVGVSRGSMAMSEDLEKL